jgi:hypothetical protein
MEIVAGVVGAFLIVIVLIDGFQTMVLPRRVAWWYRPTVLFYRVNWTVWRAIARRLPANKRRESFLSIFGPLSLPLLFAGWFTGLIIGFGLVHRALRTPINGDKAGDGLAAYCYLSGETFFTVGYGDVVATEGWGRLLEVIEAGLGFTFLAVVIGYLPILYQAFSRREVAISLLDARAGSPPTAEQLLLRYAKSGVGAGSASTFLADWERWAGELLESHLSYPVLSYYRSQHDNQSWLAALTVVLDACALLMTGAPGANVYQARLTFAMARHAAVDLALVFRTPPRPPDPDRLDPERLRRLRERLREAGMELRDGPTVDAKLAELRGLYEPFINALAFHLMFGLPPVMPDKEPVDNWQTSAWMRRAAGLGELPSPGDDHAL